MRWNQLAWVAMCVASVALADPPERDRRRTIIVDVVDTCRDAVVNISTTKLVQVRYQDSLFNEFFGLPGGMAQRNVTSVGSGAVIHETGYIVTNAHVVAQASDIRVTFADGSTLPARKVQVDPSVDLAVVKVDAPRPLHAIKLGRSSDIMIGETVIAIGNPLGLGHTVTTGIISALNRDLEVRGSLAYQGLLQTDAAINPGNSGGPLINVNNQLIGINTAIRGDAQNVGFAIPVDRLWEMVPALLDVDQAERVRFGLKVAGPNAEILDVEADSPAQKAGLQRGDRILRVDDHPVRDGIDFYARLRSEKPGSQVRLLLQRDKQDVSAAVPLEVIPLPDGNKLAADLLGVQFEELSPEARQRLDFEGAGVLVLGVERSSPAARGDIRRGDVLLVVNGKPVTNTQDVGLALEQTAPGGRMQVYVYEPDTARVRQLVLTAPRRTK